MSAIQMDTSIQCRASTNHEVVSEYAAAMSDGVVFPPVILFGTAEKCWIGDGWHRIGASQQIKALDIDAELHAGGRLDALKCALRRRQRCGPKLRPGWAAWWRRNRVRRRRVADQNYKEYVHMAPDTFDTEASPAMLADAGLDWQTWALYCVLAVLAVAFSVAAFELGRAVGHDEAWESVQQIQRGE